MTESKLSFFRSRGLAECRLHGCHTFYENHLFKGCAPVLQSY
jgi:hypothetical protein